MNGEQSLIISIQDTTTENPISLIGNRAGVCTNASDDAVSNYKRGVDCIKSGHGRALEYVNVEFVAEGFSARAIRELYTHIGGAPTRLQASTRYINYKDFNYYTPNALAKEPMYDEVMNYIADSYNKLLEKGYKREDIANILPLGMSSKVVVKCNLRMLENFMSQRLCKRAYEEMQTMAKMICQGLAQKSPEWKEIVKNLFVPKCKKAGFCVEGRSCGMTPKKDVVWLTEFTSNK